MMKKIISMTTAAALSLGLAALLPQSLTASAYSDKYAVQEFHFGIGDTNRSITISAQDSGAYASSVTPEDGYTRDSKWSLNFISTGVYEIVNSATGMPYTPQTGFVMLCVTKWRGLMPLSSRAPVVLLVIICFVPVHFGLCLHDHAVNARHFSRCDIHSPQQRGIPFQ